MSKGKKDITTQIADFVKANENKFKSGESKKIILADKKYNELLNEGFVKKRGYTLRGIEDVHLLQFRING
jgi:hypothetical protein